MRRPSLSPGRYRSITVVALALLAVINVSGAAVRLTGSGLGCDDWPRCNDRQLIDVSSTHAAIEQINRLFTGLVAVGVALAVLGSLWRRPRRRELTVLSLGLVAGVIAQVVLGGITVLVDLHPAAVQGHFVLSMLLIADAMVLVHRAGLADLARRHLVPRDLRAHVWALAAATAVVQVLGTVVTGAGPHAGDERAKRFGIDIGDIARVHAVAVWVTVAVALALFWRLRSRAADRAVLDAPLVAWTCVAIAQGALGYVQYFSGVPAVLVAFHVAGATALWCLAVWMVAGLTGVAPTADGGDGSAGEALHELGTLVDHG